MKHIVAFLLMAGFLLGSPVLATEGTEGTDDSSSSSSEVVRATVDLACVQLAIDKREGYILLNFDEYHTAARNALLARTTALKTAWANTDRTTRRAEIKIAWKNYQTALRTARKTFKTAQNTIWKDYKIDYKTCKASASDDRGTQSIDKTL